jgi:teichuronic acid biosynthesis glycosyltransferase TuaG
MPIYNGIEYINESVPSIMEQTFQDWELIIAINGLPENSVEYQVSQGYASLDPRIRVLDMFDTSGKANTLNKMISQCKYDWVAILDVDDIWLPEKLEKQVKFLENYDVVGSLCVYFENLEGTIPQIPVGDISDFDFRSVNPVINSSAIIRKKLANWNKFFEGVEDYDLWVRLRDKNKRFYNVDEVLVKHRIHTTSAFNSKDNTEKIEIIHKRSVL